MASWRDRSISSTSSTNEGWVELSPEISFQSRLHSGSGVNSDSDVMRRATNMAIERMLSGSQYSSSSSPFAVGMENINQGWGNEQLAWHLLGFYVDCNSEGDDEEEDHEHEDHHEEEEEEDPQQEDGQRRLNNGSGSSGKTVCKRKVMYAVYVDPYYQGGGLGEYSYYDQDSGQYVCYSGNCKAKMDCHSSDTQTWQLLGVFKVDKLSQGDSWMEQLFKHAGVCYWGWDNYQTAATMRELLPERCTKTDYQVNRNYLYMHVRPTQNAGLTLGLYTDSKCSTLYDQGSFKKKFDVFGLLGTTESNFNSFNTLLNGYKTCQPCIAYNLSDSDYTCNDDAGYTNCIQCVKFAIKAQSTIATPQDIRLAYMQNTMLQLGNINGTIEFSHAWQLQSQLPLAMTLSLPFYLRASICFFLGCLALYFIPRDFGREKEEDNFKMLSSPLSQSNAAQTEELDSWKQRVTTKSDGVIFVDCDPIKSRSTSSKIKNNLLQRLKKNTKKNNTVVTPESNKNNDRSSSEFNLSNHVGEEQPPSYSAHKTSLIPDEISNSTIKVVADENNILACSGKPVEAGDNSTITTNISDQPPDFINSTEPSKAFPSAINTEGSSHTNFLLAGFSTDVVSTADGSSKIQESELSNNGGSSKKRGVMHHVRSLKKKILNPLAKAPASDKPFEVQQLSASVVEPESVGKKQSEDLKQDMMTLPIDSFVSVNENSRYSIRNTQSFRKTVENLKGALDEDLLDEKEDDTGYFDVNAYLGEKPQTFDSSGMERTSVSKLAGNDKYLYDD